MRKLIFLCILVLTGLSLKAQSSGFYWNTGKLFSNSSTFNTIGIGARIAFPDPRLRIDFGISSTFSLPLIKISATSTATTFVHSQFGFDLIKSEKFDLAPQLGILLRDNMRDENPGKNYLAFVYGLHTQFAISKHLALASWFQVYHSEEKDLPNFSLGIVIR